MKKSSMILNQIRSLLVVLGLVAGMAYFSASPAAAGDLDVCPSGCSYSSIQAAITAASPGDRILVSAGTYSENITIDKSVPRAVRSERLGLDVKELPLAVALDLLLAPRGLVAVATENGFVVRQAQR